MRDRPHFLLVGNGPYLNRGCEAIIRGTVQILTTEFGPETEFTAASYGQEEEFRRQANGESDPRIRHVRLNYKRWSPGWYLDKANRFLGWQTPGHHLPLASPAKKSRFALAVGGDNYTLDYGNPQGFFETDRFLMRRGLPVCIWGASIGPFDSDPEFAKAAFAHLQRLDAILVRESVSFDYLRENGVRDNLHLVADPAFCMRPTQPPPERCPEVRPGTIGLNFSPLMADYTEKRDLRSWQNDCVDIISRIATATDRDILLIPHVFTDSVKNDDLRFMRDIAVQVQEKTGRKIPVVDNFPAAELKWIISRLDAFAGCRTHATIAALSSRVPTLSIAYSRKALGLNKDIFGNLDYCLPLNRARPEEIAGSVLHLAERAGEVRQRLQEVIPQFVERAANAGKILRQTLKPAN